MGPRRASAAALLCLLIGSLVASPFVADAAEDPLFVEWSTVLPGLTADYDPSSANECTAGKIQCVDKVIREMTRRFDRLASTCDHNAVFALTYLRTTEEYKRAATTPGFFADPGFVNHEDAVFASYYFEAYDDWAAGRTGEVPKAWRVALDAARNRTVTGSGNMMLGLSAHINRDLPYVLAEIGLVQPDGSSRKPDHDQVNQFLNRVTQPVIAELARRFDPTVDDGNVAGTYDETATLQLVVAWREQAWRNAELLVNAPTAIVRALVEQQIETDAYLKAVALEAATGYGLFDSSAARDAYCAANWNQ
ncbi:MAG: DUF5995 family protein [Actinomycetota bacterium]